MVLWKPSLHCNFCVQYLSLSVTSAQAVSQPTKIENSWVVVIIMIKHQHAFMPLLCRNLDIDHGTPFTRIYHVTAPQQIINCVILV